MRESIQSAFSCIRAEEDLKSSTKAFVREKMQKRRQTFVPRYLVTALACLCLMVFGGSWLYFTPTAAISIDINPSIELEVNRFGRVLSVTGYNDDGRVLADSLPIKHLGYADAVEQILSTDTITDLLARDEVLSIGVIGSDEAQNGAILASLQDQTAGTRHAVCYAAAPEEVAQAHELGLSYGKYRVYLTLKDLDPDVTAEQVQDMTMRQIMDRIAQLDPGAAIAPSGGEGHGKPGSAGQGNGNGNGNRNGNGNGNGHGKRRGRSAE